MKDFERLTLKDLWNIQYFSEGEDDGGNGGGQNDDNGNEPKTFTQEQVDELLKAANKNFDDKFNVKFAEMQKKHQKELDEAKKLEQMTAEEKAAKEMENLKAQIEQLQVSNARAEMMKSARTILSEKLNTTEATKGIMFSDDFLGSFLTTEAESTKANVEEFAKAFSTAVKDAVKKAMAGSTPDGTKGGDNNNTITREEILKIENSAERQKLMAQHLDLFR